MTIYPAIDIKGGRAVRLTQGRADQETVYAENPADVATQFRAPPAARGCTVVDLDGAFAGVSRGIQPGGRAGNCGVGDEGAARRSLRFAHAGGPVERALGFGVSRVVIGTRAAESEAFVGELVQALPVKKIAVGIDAKNGQVAVMLAGWPRRA